MLDPLTCWRCESCGIPAQKAADRVWDQPKREKYVTFNKIKGAGDLKSSLDIRHGDTEFGACPAVFGPLFGLIFPTYTPFPLFWNVYSVPFYVGSMQSAFLFCFTGDYN